jgi:hypothetical protein
MEKKRLVFSGVRLVKVDGEEDSDGWILGPSKHTAANSIEEKKAQKKAATRIISVVRRRGNIRRRRRG